MKVKVSKKPLIVFLSIAAAFLLAAVLSFVVPMIIPKPECPVALTNDTLYLKYSSTYGSYILQGELENISDKQVVIRNKGGMSISFKDSDDKFTDCWLLKSEDANIYNESSYIDIVLDPGEKYDFENCTWTLNGSTTITQLKVTIDGTTYYLIGNNSLPMVLGLIFAILAFIFLICGISVNKQRKLAAMHQDSLVSMCEGVDEDCVLLTGFISNKNESKKAATQSTVSVLGGLLSTLFLGFGYFKIYSGAQRKEFVLGRNGLYMLNSVSGTPNGLYRCSKENFAVDKINVKKNVISLTGTDQVTTISLSVKKNTITVEEAVERLNKIFILGAAPTAIEGNADSAIEDPFANDSAVTAQPAKASDETQLNMDKSDNDKLN